MSVDLKLYLLLMTSQRWLRQISLRIVTQISSIFLNCILFSVYEDAGNVISFLL